MITAIIFDLDNCLSAADEVGEALYEPAFDAIRSANQGTLSDGALNAAFADAWRHPLDVVARQHGFSQAMLAAGWKVFAKMEVNIPLVASKTRLELSVGISAPQPPGGYDLAGPPNPRVCL